MLWAFLKDVKSTLPIFINKIVPSHWREKLWFNKTSFTCHLSIELCYQSMKWISYQDYCSLINTFLNLNVHGYRRTVQTARTHNLRIRMYDSYLECMPFVGFNGNDRTIHAWNIFALPSCIFQFIRWPCIPSPNS